MSSFRNAVLDPLVGYSFILFLGNLAPLEISTPVPRKITEHADELDWKFRPLLTSQFLTQTPDQEI